MNDQNPHAFRPIKRQEAIKNLQQLPPSILEHISEKIKSFNSKPLSEIAEIEIQELISELTYVYFMIPVTLKAGHVIFRGRQVDTDQLLPTVNEFYAPCPEKAKVQRANMNGESIFYGANSEETVFAEVRAKANSCVNMAAFSVKVDFEITAYLIGEIDHYRRWSKNRFLPQGLEKQSLEVFNSLDPNVALAIHLVDAFLADHFSRTGKDAYRVSNYIAREFLRVQAIDAIIYPSVEFPGGQNYAINDDISKEKLEVKGCTAIKILNDYGYGSYRGGRYGIARVDHANTLIPWITPDDSHNKIQQLKLEIETTPDPIGSWLISPRTQR